MTRQQIICDGCKSEIKSDGYSASITVGKEDLAIDIKRGIDAAYENHYCGRQCVMLSINGLVGLLQPVNEKEAGLLEQAHASREERKHACTV